MNKFKDYATATAFNITLSKRQVYVLLNIKNKELIIEYSHAVATIRALENKGLTDKWNLTEAGKLMVKLLEAAGLEKEG